MAAMGMTRAREPRAGRPGLQLDTPIGVLTLWAVPEGLRAIEFGAHLGELRPERQEKEQPGERVLTEAARQLGEYFAGTRKAFELPLVIEGTEFERAVWEILRSIPYGQTMSYGQLAADLGRPSAARAVGRASGSNPLPIVIPCHRLVGSRGELTGFGGGLPIKLRLLELEGAVLC